MWYKNTIDRSSTQTHLPSINPPYHWDTSMMQENMLEYASWSMWCYAVQPEDDVKMDIKILLHFTTFVSIHSACSLGRLVECDIVI